MSDAIDFAPLHPTTLGPSEPGELERLVDVTVEVSVEIGRTSMTLGEALALGPGSVVGLHRMAGEPVDLLVNGRVIARGEVVVIDEEFGLRVTDVAAPRGAELPPVTEPVEIVPEPVVAEPVEPGTAEAA